LTWTSRERHLEHGGDELDPVLQVLGHLLEAPQAVLARDVHLHDRELGEVELEDHRLLGRRRDLRLGDVHLLPNELERLRHVHPGRELDQDARVALDRSRCDLLGVRDLVQLFLERTRDQGLDILGGHAGIGGVHRDVRHRDLRHRLLGDAEIGDQAAQDNDGREDEHARRMVHGERGQPELLVALSSRPLGG
jgi:hypothetical protein